MPGKGMLLPENPMKKGDDFIFCTRQFPTCLTPQQKEMLRQALLTWLWWAGPGAGEVKASWAPAQPQVCGGASPRHRHDMGMGWHPHGTFKLTQ